MPPSSVDVSKAPQVEPDAPTRPSRLANRWLALAVLALAQLMVVLDATVVNIALPSAQADLAFSNDSRQWVVTGYALVFGSLLLLGGRLSDFFGRRRMFVVGRRRLRARLGARRRGRELPDAARRPRPAGCLRRRARARRARTAVDDVHHRQRTRQGLRDLRRHRGCGGGAGLLIGGVLTEYASWRWCLYVNLVIAALALVGAALVLRDDTPTERPKLDLPGADHRGRRSGRRGLRPRQRREQGLGSGADARCRSCVGVLRPRPFVVIEERSSHPLLPMRVVLDRNRGGAYLTLAIAGIGMFGVFLFLTYYLHRHPAVQPGADRHRVPADARPCSSSSPPRGRPARAPGRAAPDGARSAPCVAALGMALMTRVELDSTYVGGVLPAAAADRARAWASSSRRCRTPPPAGSTPRDAGVASAMINTVQQVGGSIGTALLSSFAATAAAHYAAGTGRRSQQLLRAGHAAQLPRRVLVVGRVLRRLRRGRRPWSSAAARSRSTRTRTRSSRTDRRPHRQPPAPWRRRVAGSMTVGRPGVLGRFRYTPVHTGRTRRRGARHAGHPAGARRVNPR